MVHALQQRPSRETVKVNKAVRPPLRRMFSQTNLRFAYTSRTHSSLHYSSSSGIDGKQSQLGFESKFGGGSTPSILHTLASITRREASTRNVSTDFTNTSPQQTTHRSKMAAAQQNLPTRTMTNSTDAEDAIPGEDTSEVGHEHCSQHSVGLPEGCCRKAMITRSICICATCVDTESLLLAS